MEFEILYHKAWWDTEITKSNKTFKKVKIMLSHLYILPLLYESFCIKGAKLQRWPSPACSHPYLSVIPKRSSFTWTSILQFTKYFAKRSIWKRLASIFPILCTTSVSKRIQWGLIRWGSLGCWFRPGAACCYQDNFKQCSFGVNPVYCNVCERLDSTRQLFGRFVNLPDWDLIGNTEVRFRPRLETSKFNTTNFCDNWQQLLFPVLQLIDCFLCFTADMIQRYEIHSYLSWLAALHFDNRFSNSFSKCILCKLFDLREDSSASPWTTETSACERC